MFVCVRAKTERESKEKHLIECNLAEGIKIIINKKSNHVFWFRETLTDFRFVDILRIIF